MKKLLTATGLFLLSVIAAGLFVTRDIGPKNRFLASTNLPALIPTRSFYADPRSAFRYIPSADGKYVSLEKASILGRNIVVKDVESGKEIAQFPIGLQNIRWHPTKPLLRFEYENHDWEASPYSPDQKNWKRISPVKLSGGWQKFQVPKNDEMPIITFGRVSQRSLSHVWLVSQDGLKAEKLAEGNKKTRYWVFDHTEAKPVLRVDSLDQATQRIFRKIGVGWEKLIDVKLLDSFQPISNVRSDGTLLARSARGRDKVALVEFDTQTGEEKIILENSSADIAGATYLTYSTRPDVIRLGANNMKRKALTKSGQVYLDILSQFPQPVSVGLISPSPSGRYVTVALSPQSRSYVYILIDLANKSYVKLGEYHFRRFKDDLVQENFVTFKARDGVELPAILTLPKSVESPIPFIVKVHGGPSSHDRLGYNHDTQYLANRGYGVLSVNFRGSTGFGKLFQKKGFMQFGRTMQDDISDAANWLVAEGMADPAALAVIGSSYGGYAAAMAMMRDPGLFEAAIVEFPLLDIEFQSRYHPGFWEGGMAMYWNYFGKLENPEHVGKMREYSPVHRAHQINGSIMVLAGIRDEVTAVQQVKNFESEVKKAGKDVSFHYFPYAGHGAQHWRDRLHRARLIEDFLSDKLGGRSGGFEFVELAPGFID